MAATNEANKIKNGWHPRVKTTVNDALVRGCASSNGNPVCTLYIYFLKQETPCDAFFSSAQSCDPFGYCHEVVYASTILSHWLLDMDLESDFLGRTSPLLLTLLNHAADKQVFVSHEVIVKVVILKPSSFITIGGAVAILNLRSQLEQPSHCISVFLISFSLSSFFQITWLQVVVPISILVAIKYAVIARNFTFYVKKRFMVSITK